MNALKTKLSQIEDIEKHLKKVESEVREIQLEYVNAISEVCDCSRNFEYNRKSKLLAIRTVGDKSEYFFWCFKSEALEINIQVPILKAVINDVFGIDTEMIIKVQRAINEMDNKYSNSNSERECDVVSEVRKLEKLVEDSRDSETIKKKKRPFDVKVMPYSDRAEKRKSEYSESIKRDISKQPDVVPVTDITFKNLDVINGELCYFDSPETKKAVLEGRKEVVPTEKKESAPIESKDKK